MGAPHGAVGFYFFQSRRMDGAEGGMAQVRPGTDARRRTGNGHRSERYLPTRHRRHDRDAGIASQPGTSGATSNRLQPSRGASCGGPGTASTSFRLTSLVFLWRCLDRSHHVQTPGRGTVRFDDRQARNRQNSAAQISRGRRCFVSQFVSSNGPTDVGRYARDCAGTSCSIHVLIESRRRLRIQAH
jgi:hypothetical protein